MVVTNLLPSARLQPPRAVHLNRRCTMSSIPHNDLWGGQSLPYTPQQQHRKKNTAHHQRWKERHPNGEAASSKRYRERHPEQAAVSSKKWREHHPEQEHIRHREQNWKRYGINLTWKQFLEMLAAQNYQCRSCETPIGIYAPVDHNHITGKIRGILCSPCNKAIGFSGDNPTILEKCCRYLREYDG